MTFYPDSIYGGLSIVFSPFLILHHLDRISKNEQNSKKMGDINFLQTVIMRNRTEKNEKKRAS
jgi:hypothetical protein